ncbi:hypothetical protein AAMO2058_000115400 [Amorphochlora amoebiformis]
MQSDSFHDGERPEIEEERLNPQPIGGLRVGNGRYVIETKRLAKGASCSVRAGFDMRTNCKVAVKFYDEDSNNAFGRERYVLSRVKHKNVIAMVEALWFTTDEGEEGVIVQEFAHHGDLLDHIIEYGELEPDLGRAFALQIIQGLTAMQKAGIYHRDVKPENILISEDFTAKICDFGFSGILKADGKLQPMSETSMSTRVGSLSYMAPEVFKDVPQTEAIDVWSLGVTIFVMLTGAPPYVRPIATMDPWYVVNCTAFVRICGLFLYKNMYLMYTHIHMYIPKIFVVFFF